MTVFFSSFFTHKSELLTSYDFDIMCQGGDVLEKTERGPKVIQLKNGDIIKLFRVKRFFSGARIYSYARRFCRNAIRLNHIGIATIKVKKLYHFSDGVYSAVLYEPLEGETIRHVAQSAAVNDELTQSLATFLSKLHQKGVHFHSLHTGNVVITPADEIGLIDISDLSIYPWPLFCRTRVRSFNRLCRYNEDIKKFGERYWQLCLEHYFEVSGLGMKCRRRIKQCVDRHIAF